MSVAQVRPILLSLGLLLLLTGCADRSGPGSYRGAVTLPAGSPGAVLLRLTGSEIRSVSGEGGTMAWMSADPGGGVRLLLIDPDPAGAMTFRMEVADRSAPLPSIAVLQMVDRANEPLPETTEVRVRFER